MSAKKHENPWRADYEFYAAMIWLLSLIFLITGAMEAEMPTAPIWYLSSVAIAFMVWNLNGALRVWSFKFAIAGKGVQLMSLLKIREFANKSPQKIWLGYGFDWKTEHAQRIYDLKKFDPESLYPPKFLLRIKERFYMNGGETIGALPTKDGNEQKGLPWIHGVEPNEREVSMPIDDLIGNTMIIGMTRCGKTRMLDVLQAQIVFRECASLFVIDPKGDDALRANIKNTAKSVWREKDFHCFDLAHPSESIRIDPLKNYNNISELASRVAELVPGDGAGDSFKAFAWDVSNAIFLGLIEIGEKPTLIKLRQFVESGVDLLLLQCLPVYFAKMADQVPEWEKRAREYVSRAIKRKEGEAVREPNPKEMLTGYLFMYEGLYKLQGFRSEAIEALSNIHKHDITHYGKMLASFKPTLSMLTTGEIGKLLSPDISDLDDERLSTDLLSLSDSKAIVFIGLNAMGDKTVASAIGSMLLSDFAAVASMRYNFRSLKENAASPIYLMIDEASQVVNEPYMQILSMSGGAGFVNITATQTIPDFSARLGDKDKALVMLGNYNNFFVLRTSDPETIEYVSNNFGTTYILSSQTTQGTNSSTEKNISHFGGTISERVNETLEDIFPVDLFDKLPNWQYIAKVSGGRMIKGRVPILDPN